MKKLVILSVTLFFTSSLFSATILVPADQPSIQAGTNAGANGDSVLVADRIYIGSGSINSLCGDVNGDGLVGNVLDLTYMIEYFYRGGAPPPDIAAADMDGCPGVDVRDFTFFIDRIFRGGPPPCPGP